MSTQYVMTMPTGVTGNNYPLRNGDVVALADGVQATVVNVSSIVGVEMEDGTVRIMDRGEMVIVKRPGVVAGFGEVADENAEG